MKIAWLVTRGDSIGGAQIHVRDLALQAHRDGHDVLVLTGIAGALTDQLDAAGIRTRVCLGMLREISPQKDWAAIQALRTILREEAPDLLSTHSSKAGVIGRIAANREHIPVLFTAHGWAFTGGVPQPKRLIYRVIERALAPLASRIICVSEYDRTLGIAAGMGAGRLVTIHNGMPDLPANRRAVPDHGQTIRAVMTARFDRQKDHETLFRALLDVPNLQLDLIGDGPDRPRIEQLLQRLGLSDRVNILGQRTDVADLLAAANLFVLSSHWEGFPRSTLEAMRAGLPVIVSDVGGAAEAVIIGETGFIVPPADRDALVVALRTLANDPDMRVRMGQAGRQRYEKDFTFDRMYAETTALYDDVLVRFRSGQ